MTDSKKKKNVAINRICLHFYSASHTYPLLILRDNFLSDNYSFTALGAFNSMIPFLNHISPLSSLTLYHQLGKPEWGLFLQPVPAPLCLAGGLAGSRACLGFLASISKWAACASSQTISPVKYCDSLVNSTVWSAGNPRIAKPTNNYSIYNCLLLCM